MNTRTLGKLTVTEREWGGGWLCDMRHEDGREGSAVALRRGDAYDAARADLHHPRGESRYED